MFNGECIIKTSCLIIVNIFLKLCALLHWNYLFCAMRVYIVFLFISMLHFMLSNVHTFIIIIFHFILLLIHIYGHELYISLSVLESKNISEVFLNFFLEISVKYPDLFLSMKFWLNFFCSLIVKCSYYDRKDYFIAKFCTWS